MAYPMNIFLLLAKSLRATPDIIQRTRTTEYAERKRQFEIIKKHLTNQDSQQLKLLEKLVEGMKKEYVVREHCDEKQYPAPLKKELTDTLDPAASRLIVVAHGDPATPKFVALDQGDDKNPTARVSAQVVARWIKVLLNGKRVNRISLHICYAAKIHASPVPGRAAESFALSFAKCVGELADSVSARTNSVTTEENTGNRVTSDTEHGRYQYREALHKLIYSTGPAAASKPSDYQEKEVRDKLVNWLFEAGKKQAKEDALERIRLMDKRQ